MEQVDCGRKLTIRPMNLPGKVNVMSTYRVLSVLVVLGTVLWIFCFPNRDERTHSVPREPGPPVASVGVEKIFQGFQR